MAGCSRQGSLQGSLFAIALTGLVACGPGGALGEDESPSSTVTSEASTQTQTTSESSTSSETGTQQSTADNTFVPPDMDLPSSCDPFAQDCAEGEKCVAVALGGTQYDANICVAVMGDGAPGEDCTSAGVSEGTDDCDATSMCAYLQEVEGVFEGICVELCLGTADDPECSPGTHCTICAGGCPNWCVQDCDPLEQDCPEGLGCYYGNASFECALRASDWETGEPCGFVNDCAPGNYCAAAEVLPSCNGSACCAEFCDLNVGDCAIEGTQCSPFFEQPLPGHEQLGVCIVPQP